MMPRAEIRARQRKQVTDLFLDGVPSLQTVLKVDQAQEDRAERLFMLGLVGLVALFASKQSRVLQLWQNKIHLSSDCIVPRTICL
jgi:hypothetical protein